MIVHSIVVKQPEVIVVQRESSKMGKLEYASFISRIPLKVGDYIINASLSDSTLANLHQNAVFKLEDIQEVHLMVEYEYTGQTDLPRCLYVKNGAGSAFWTPPHRWKAAPKELLERLGLV